MSVEAWFQAMMAGGGIQTIGTIYEKSSWSNLTDFTSFGTSGASIVSNKIRFTGGTNFTGGLMLTRVSALEQWKMTLRCTVDVAPGASTFGLAVGSRSINGWANQAHSTLGKIHMQNNANFGKSEIYHMDNLINVNSVGQTAATTWSTNDEIEIIFERSYWTFTTSLRNITTGGATVTTSYSYTASGGFALDNTFKYAIYNVGGTYSVTYLKVESLQQKNINLLCVGDSKTEGQATNDITSRFSNLLNSNYPVSKTLAGPSDRTVEIVQLTTEILEINPQKVLISVGRNDLASGVATGTWQANISTLQSTLSSAGITVVWLTMEPDTQSQTTLKSYISGLSVPFVQATGLTLAADGIHPNITGHGQVRDQVVSSGLLT